MPGLVEETKSQETEMTVVAEKKSKKTKKIKKENEADESITEDVKPKKKSKKNGTLKETNLDESVVSSDEVKEKVKKSKKKAENGTETDLNETADSEEVSKKEKKKSKKEDKKKSKKEKSEEEDEVTIHITRSMDAPKPETPKTEKTPAKSPKFKKKSESKKKNDKSSTEESEDVEMSDETTKPKKATKRKSEDTPSKTETGSKKKKTENGPVEIDESTITAMDGTEESEAQKEGNFDNFAIPAKIRQKLEARGVKYLFPVQYKSFNQISEGKDVIARARTGTGKTFSFAIPLVCKLESTSDKNKGKRPPRVLVLTPTRELCTQVCNDFKCLGTTIRCQAVYGGVGYDVQQRAFREGFDILVGTPGRVFDYIERGTFDVTKLEYVVLDEVDQMLDMGFAPQVDKILTNAYNAATPESRPQTMLFSATVPEWVKTTANKYMKDDAVWIDLIGKDRVKTATTVEHLAIRCDWHQRNIVIGDLIQIYSGNHGRAIVFCETKKHCDELSTDPAIKQDVHVMHGDIQQSKRELVLKKFREGVYRVLVTTNVAARGLDIPEVDLVIQKELPQDVDSYIHRSGRTGRAGRCGIAACLYSNRDERDLENLERRAGITFKRQGIPSNDSIVKAASDDAVRTIQGVAEEARSMFYDSAESLLESMTPTQAIAAALAALTGNTEMQQKSLLTGRSGFTTYVLEAMSEKNNAGFAISCLRNAFGHDFMSKIGKVQMSKSKKQFLFDVPTDAVKTIKADWVDTKWEFLIEATEVPELEQTTQSNYGGGSGPYGGKRNYGSGSRGGGGRGRGFRHGTFKRGGNFGRSSGNNRIKFN